MCGSVAACKSPELLRLFLSSGCNVGATLTRSAQEFVRPLLFEALGATPVYGGMWPGESAAPSDVFGHLDPAQNADVLCIAPATANTIGKLANGIADDMLSAQALAFKGPIVIAPAMNPRLWDATATRENWDKLRQRGCVCLEPGLGSMACGEEGQGRLPDPYEILMRTLRALAPQDLAGKSVLLVITSYSIHYTKLYEILMQQDCPANGILLCLGSKKCSIILFFDKKVVLIRQLIFNVPGLNTIAVLTAKREQEFPPFDIQVYEAAP